MLKIITAVAALAALAAPAHAGITFTSTAFSNGGSTTEKMVEDFDHSIATGFSLTGGEVNQGLIKGYSAPPADDFSKYLTLTAGKSATLASNSDLQSLSFYLGSADSYNYVSFLNDDALVQSFTGSQLVVDANGDQFSDATNRSFHFDFGTSKVNRVVFGSSGYSMELDDVLASAVSAAPEPSTWALMIAGIAFLGAALRLGRRRQSAFVST